MKNLAFRNVAVVLALSLGLVAVVPAQAQQLPKKTKQVEKQADWVSLFDGKTTKGWRGAYMPAFPEKGWKVEDGCLVHDAATGGESNSGGDIITEKQYTNFELELEFNIAPGGNSGIKYFVQEMNPRPAGSAIGCEFQILDDDKHPDAKLGKDGNRTIGSLYDLIPAKNKKPNPPGSWNKARVVVRGEKVQHYLNDDLVVNYTRGDDTWRALVATSKYRDKPSFGEAKSGHILLQDHGDLVKFRNIRIRELK